MSVDDEIAIALSVILGGFFLISLGVVVYFLRKHYRRKLVLNGNFRPFHSSDDEPMGEGTFTFSDAYYGERDMETETLHLIPYGVALLKACKELTTKLLEAVVDGTSSSGSGVIVGSLTDVIDAIQAVTPKVDKLTKCMYPPLNEMDVMESGRSLVESVQKLDEVTRENCNPSRIRFLDDMIREVFHQHKLLAFNLERFKRRQEQLDFDRMR